MRSDQTGTEILEYTLIIALLLLVGVVGMATLSEKGINNTFQTASAKLEAASL
ncbi:MAG: hypothetical protein HY587_07175 [Candidatus Omnitrophica bacterium]|nr:hypothetical protein [Candidatus Omnitrophota bacterium]